jgi:predicted nucleotidyltransferase
MSVAGFREAFESTVKVILRRDPLLEIKVASLPSLTALKLVAWKNRGITNNKDAKDIGTYKLPGVASVCLNAKNWNFK